MKSSTTNSTAAGHDFGEHDHAAEEAAGERAGVAPGAIDYVADGVIDRLFGYAERVGDAGAELLEAFLNVEVELVKVLHDRGGDPCRHAGEQQRRPADDHDGGQRVREAAMPQPALGRQQRGGEDDRGEYGQEDQPQPRRRQAKQNQKGGHDQQTRRQLGEAAQPVWRCRRHACSLRAS